MLAGIAPIIGEIAPLFGQLFALDAQQRLGNPLLDMVESRLKSATLSQGAKAIAQAKVDRYTSLNAAANGIRAIAQPSSEDQNRLVQLEKDIKKLEVELQSI